MGHLLSRISFNQLILTVIIARGFYNVTVVSIHSFIHTHERGSFYSFILGEIHCDFVTMRGGKRFHQLEYIKTRNIAVTLGNNVRNTKYRGNITG